jgi:hypothetical protein
MALVAGGATSAGGLTALVVKYRRKKPADTATETTAQPSGGEHGTATRRVSK